MIKSGKRFEQNFKNSVPSDVFYYRFKDGTSNWATSDKSGTRFQATNICDCMLFKNDRLIFAELKNHKGKSLPLTAIRENQLKEMSEAWEYHNVYPTFIVNFEDVDRCFALGIFEVIGFIRKGERKSIPLEHFEKFGVEIPCVKKKANTSYDLTVLFD